MKLMLNVTDHKNLMMSSNDVSTSSSVVSDVSASHVSDIHIEGTGSIDGDLLGSMEADIVIDRVRAVTLKAPIVVEGKEVKCVVDTGAEVTVMSEKTFLSIPEGRRPTLKRAVRNLVVAEAGRKMGTLGVADLNIKIGPLTFVWSIYVCPIGDDLLLGCDIIDEKNITINTKRGLEVDGQWVDCDVCRKSDKVSRVLLKESVTVPPNTEVILPGYGVNVEIIDTRYGSIEPIVEDERKIIIARCLVDPYTKIVPVRLVNLENYPVKIRKNYLLGELHPVTNFEKFADEDVSVKSDCYGSGCSDVHFGQNLSSEKSDIHVSCEIPYDWKCCKVSESASDSGDVGTKADIPKLPDHLVELYNSSSEKLTKDCHKVRLAEVLIKFADAFARNKSDLGSCSLIKHKIDTAGAAPVRQGLRRTPQGFEEEEEKYLQEQIDAGVIVPSKSAWASGVVLVRKTDGTVRWCIDYRALNSCTIKDAYPLPKISQCLDCLANASVFSVCDLQSGYWQLQVDESDRHKTAFITKYGLYEYTKMPFGLCNAPSTFQRCMELIFRGLQWKTLLIYLDDIILFSSNLDDHFVQLSEVLGRLQKAGLKLKPSKCDFFKNEVLYLGHVVNKDGVRPNPKIVHAVKNWKVPQNVKEVQQFLGLCNYYRQFILGFSEVAFEISQLTKKDVSFIWSEKCQEAFDKLKVALCEAPILAYPVPHCDFILDTDASNVGIGSVLSQVQNGKECVISYGSKKLDKVQQRYSVTRRELLAVVTFIHQYRHFLLGRRFLLRTDHGSLKWLFSFKDPQGQLARWIETLSQYTFTIEHRPGSKHKNADALSRKDGENPLCEHQLKGETCADCTECTELMDEWSDFRNSVDNIVELNKGTSVRVVTRSQTQGSLTSNWLKGYTYAQLEKFQREDDDLKPVHEWMDKTLPARDEVVSLSPASRKYWLNFNNLERKNGVLYQKQVQAKPSDEYFQLLVPKVLRKEVVTTCHDTMYAGHFGIHKTLEKVKANFHWYKMNEDVKIHVGMCLVCNKVKGLNKKPRAALQSYVVGHPLDRIALDVIGPLPKSRRNNKYILVIGDHFTRWMEAFPLPHQQAEQIAEKLVFEFMSRFGTPLEIHTDQGRNFESDIFTHICKLFEIKKTRSTPYRPCSNGIIERFNATLEKMIQNFVNKNIDNWDVYIGILMAAYRSTPHPATGFTPNKLMLGREVLLPKHLLFPFPKSIDDTCKSIHTYVEELSSNFEEVYSMARENLKASSVHQKKDYDTRVSQSSYRVGELVFKYNDVAKKLQEKWQGPFIISKVLSPVLYEICNKNKTSIVHHDKLKLYLTEDIPKWVMDFRHRLQAQM